MGKKKIQNIFLTGILVVVPLALTVFILVWLFNFFDGILGGFLKHTFGWYIPGLGILTTVLLVFLAGLIGGNMVGKQFSGLVERLFSSLPLVKSIYAPIRDMLKSFTGSEKSFSKVVLVQFPNAATRTIGLIVDETLQINGEPHASIYLPNSPNPTNGWIVLVRQGEYEVLDISVDEAMKMLVSIGAVTPKSLDMEPGRG